MRKKVKNKPAAIEENEAFKNEKFIASDDEPENPSCSCCGRKEKQ